jgi:Arc/MetJ-type ribon-helix-helix transcriptional regulator
MATISVPLSPKLQELLDGLVSDRVGANRADVMRRALEHFAEEEAINAVLRAEREVSQGKILRGDAHDILGD